MSTADLDRELQSLATAVDWPPTPDVASTIATHLPIERSARPRKGGSAGRWNFLQRPLATAGLVAIVAAGAIGGAVQPVRAQIENLLGIAGGERVVRVEKVAPGTRLDLGRAVTIDEARKLATFRLRVPGTPTLVRLGGDLSGGAVSLFYGNDTVLTEFPETSIFPGLKQVGTTVVVRSVDINGEDGLWVAAGPRVLLLQGPGHRVHRRTAALPGSGVLLWQEGSLALRLETRRGLKAALALARSAK